MASPRLPRLQTTSLTSTLSSSRPLALWDADPRTSNPIILARFQPTELNYALTLATTWAHRYETLALGEIPSPDTPSSPGPLLALWQNGRRIDPLP